MNGTALKVILAVDVFAALVWTGILALFVGWNLAWVVGTGSAVFGFVVLALLYQFAEVQNAREDAASAADLDDVDEAGVQ